MPRVIVSGAGSLTGFEVIRALADAPVEVWGTDIDPDVPAREHAARIIPSPPVDSDELAPFVRQLCADGDTLCYLPILIDEIILWSELASRPETVLAPDAEVGALMKSKRALGAFCSDAGIAYASPIDTHAEPSGPVIVKDARFEQDRSRRRPPQRYPSVSDVPPSDRADPDRVICPLVDGDEVVVHVVSDFRGNTTPCVAMRRLEMVGGHDVRSETIPLTGEIADIAAAVLEALRGRCYGPVDMQLVGSTLIDLDFNFPSALPVFAASGLNSPALLVAALLDGSLADVTPSYHRMVRDPVTRAVELT